ncbi:MAG: (2Fe-2S)-binding protein [Rhodocyclaceae bacterium]
MFVCVCNAVTERDIGSAVAEGCRSLRELRAQLGVGTCCGRCCDCARSVLRDTLHAHTSDRFAAMPQLAAA